jgi:Protein of unknown function (DUF4019)
MFARLPIASLLVASLLLLGPPTQALAQAGPAKPSTVTAVTPTPDDRARQWLVLVDDKNYAQSWNEASKAFQSRQKTDAWAAEAAAKRTPLGAVASRDLKSIDLSRNDTVVIRYDTEFAHKAQAVETVTLDFENGGWSVTDYSLN